MPREKIIIKIVILANHPSNRYTNAVNITKQAIIMAKSYHLLLLLVTLMMLKREVDLTGI